MFYASERTYIYIYMYGKVRSASVLGSMVMFSAYKLQSVKPDLPQNVIPIAAFTPHKRTNLAALIPFYNTVPGDSKCPFHPPVGGHLTFERVT